MTGETVQFDKAAEQAKPEPRKRQTSTISFPYLDLDTAVEVAHAMYKTRGHSAMEAHELAATMDQTLSGAFRLKTGTARIFGLTEKEGRDATKLSGIGLRIIEPDTEAEARASAFLAVPLYSAIYENYKGQRLPPSKALEREMENLGVSSKQTDKARQAFERSARQAGFFAKGEDRLVKPHFDGAQNVSDVDNQNDAPANEEQAKGGDNGGGGSGNHHPLIQGMIDRLPMVDEPWSENDRKAWLTMAESIFAVIYTKGSEVKRSESNKATGE
ncbi:hypothetical protein [Erythrobacter sp. JK5]|uniref:hypothetical protein n=1 Tax=Erythrobacter sp. JK5 TaxID=2829500 RepID=UPI001BA643BD|nr:hypothetical protein [Erythrobacter sp. JK5]QUL37891.1 hypothetical protein KDC96_00160 [Erythrobacter sp. JK5]